MAFPKNYASAALSILEGVAIQYLYPIPIWGVFDSSGNKICEYDTVTAMTFKGSAKVTNAPVQDGSFVSYNKVVDPFVTTIRLTKGGSSSDVGTFIKALEAAKDTTDLYSVYTPQKNYTGVNIVDVSYSRTAASGKSMVSVDLVLQEIRTAYATYTTTQATTGTTTTKSTTNATSPTSAAAKSTGTVSTSTSNQSKLSSLGNSASSVFSKIKAAL
jgi:hypothetical protein